MKDMGTDIERMIMQAHYMHSLDVEARAEESLPEMERQDYIDMIQSLRTMLDGQATMLESMRKEHEADVQRIAVLTEQLAELTARVTELTQQLAKARKSAETHSSRNRVGNQNRYATTSKKGNPVRKNDTGKTRQQEKDETDTKDDLMHDGDGSTAQDIDQNKVKEENVTRKRGPRGRYTLMDCAKVETLESLSPVLPKDWKVVGQKDVDEYTRVSYIKGTRFKVYVVEDGFGFRHDMYIPADSSDTRRPGIETIAGTHATPELVAGIAIDRFQMHVPVYRQMARLANEGMHVSRQTVGNWLANSADMLDGLMKALKVRLLRKLDVLHIDETWCRVRVPVEGLPNGEYRKKYVWCLINKATNVTYFLYDNDCDDSRGLRPIKSFLGDFLGGIQTDAYNVYKFFCGENEANKHALCWAHVRTRFWDTARAVGDRTAQWFVKQINYLFDVETDIKSRHLTVDKIAIRRQRDDVRKVLESLKKRGERLLGSSRLQLSDMMERALKYMLGGWDKLQTYLTDGRFDIDNLEAERKIRPFTVGRKNSVHFGSEAGVRIATTFYTIIETCKMCGVSPLAYLTYVLRQLRDGNRDYEALLPCNLAKVLA